MINKLLRIRMLACETFQEIAIHNRWFHVSIWSLLVFVFGGRFLMELPLGSSSPKLLYGLGQGIISGMAGAVLIVLLAYHLFNELETGSLQYYLVRRVARCEYLVAKVLGSWLAVVLVVLLADIVLATLVHLEIKEITALGNEAAGPGVLAWIQLFFYQSLHLLVLASLTACLVHLSTSFLFAALTTFLLWLSGLLIRGANELAGSWDGVGGTLLGIARLIIPRFEVWDVSSSIWYDGPFSGGDILASLLVGILYSVCLSALAIFCFNRRDL